MELNIANIESFTKYADKMPTRQPVGDYLQKFYSGDKAQVDSFIKSITKPKVQLPSDVANSAAKTFKNTFCIAQGSPRPFINKINLHELFSQAMKVIKAIK